MWSLQMKFGEQSLFEEQATGTKIKKKNNLDFVTKKKDKTYL